MSIKTSVETHQGKIRVRFQDYDYPQDLESRVLMHSFSSIDIEVLEEIFFSSLTISIPTLAEELGLTIEEISPTLHKLEKSGLLKIEPPVLKVDHERRKYFELEMQRFSADFRPGLHFIEQLFRKVPIQNIPFWYAVSLTSDNLFTSLLDKYLATPQLFTRHFNETHFEEELINQIVKMLYASEELAIRVSVVQTTFNLSIAEFTRIAILLEFNLLAVVSYKKEASGWVAFLTPIAEWQEFSLFLREQSNHLLTNNEEIKSDEESFCLINGLSKIAEHLRVNKTCSDFPIEIVDLAHKLGFIEKTANGFSLSSLASDWSQGKKEHNAAHFYRIFIKHVHEIFPEKPLYQEKIFREIEKALRKLASQEWILFEKFLPTSLISIKEGSKVELVSLGSLWRYRIPTYSQQEASSIQEIMQKWFTHMGFIEWGSINDKPCFRITDFGKDSFFG